MMRLPLWFKGLTPELVQIAENELGETPEVREKALTELKRLIEKHKDIYSRKDDIFLLRFLRVKKFDTQKAFEILRNYQGFRTRHASAFTCLKPSDVKHVVEMNTMAYLPHRSPEGCHIGVMRVGAFDPNLAKLEELMGAVLISGELVFECEVTQICGGVLIIDFQGITFQHYTMFLTVSFIKFIITAYQDCWPQRVRGIHLVHQPSALTALYHILKPFLKKKLLERLHFHGNDLKSLHKCVPKELLPSELGGDIGSLKQNTEYKSYFFSQEDYITNINKYGKLKK